MRILVTGKNGQLGQSIKKIVNKKSDNFLNNCDFVFVGRNELDLKSVTSINTFFDKNKFDIIINCAAYTKVDKAEADIDQAYLINHLAVKEIALIAQKNNMKLIHISTDFVFDGSKNQSYNETDDASPVNIYGKSKLAGELAIFSIMNSNAIILRTSWVYSEFGNNFVNTIIINAKKNKKLQIVSDQYGTPTYASDLAQAIMCILTNDKFSKREIPSQTFHYSNEGKCSWFDFAKEIVGFLKINCSLYPINSYEYPQAAKRPKNSVMSKIKISEEFDLSINHWKVSLKDCLKKITRIN